MGIEYGYFIHKKVTVWYRCSRATQKCSWCLLITSTTAAWCGCHGENCVRPDDVTSARLARNPDRNLKPRAHHRLYHNILYVLRHIKKTIALIVVLYCNLYTRNTIRVIRRSQSHASPLQTLSQTIWKWAAILPKIAMIISFKAFMKIIILHNNENLTIEYYGISSSQLSREYFMSHYHF